MGCRPAAGLEQKSWRELGVAVVRERLGRGVGPAGEGHWMPN